MTKATRKATFTGTRNTPTTSVAIIWPPAGNAAIRGLASIAYRSLAQGNRHRNTMITARIARRSRSRSSTRWEMKVSCVVIRDGDRSDRGLLRRRRRALRFAPGFALRLGRGGFPDLRHGIELTLGFRDLALHRVNRRIDAALEPARRILEGGLEFAQLLELDLAVDVGLDVVDIALQTAEQVAHGARHARQALGSDDDEGHHGDHHQLGESDVKHDERTSCSRPGPCPASGSGADPQVLALSLISPSMVRPLSWAEDSLSECLSAPDSFMPSLNPRTAPPRSVPILRSFFVPKTSNTINSTTSQCQMLQVPMALPFQLRFSIGPKTSGPPMTWTCR